ncbi:MAG TPA: hypothetical protein VFX76_10520 [Roseiflexaceae bacterium]|nr:hypothetical protein [Roseiflexaceae bacterium]
MRTLQNACVSRDFRISSMLTRMHRSFESSSGNSRIDQTLRVLRWIGMAGVLGGLVILIGYAFVDEKPADLLRWRDMVGTMRTIFYSTVFAGILILVPVGAILWWRKRAALRGQRWFRLMMVILLITIPALHISARLTSHALQAAVEASEFERAWMLWSRLTWLFVGAFIVFMVATAIAQAKPRLGQSA